MFKLFSLLVVWSISVTLAQAATTIQNQAVCFNGNGTIESIIEAEKSCRAAAQVINLLATDKAFYRARCEMNERMKCGSNVWTLESTVTIVE